MSTSQLRPKAAAPIESAVASGFPSACADIGGCYRVCHGSVPRFPLDRINTSLAGASTTKVMKNRMRPSATRDEV